VAIAIGEDAMNPESIIKVLSVFVMFLAPTASATYYYDTEDIQQQVISEAKRQNLAPSLALAIAKVESNFNPNALSHAGAKGVMQIMPRTAEQVFGVNQSRLFEPDVNIKLGVKFIKQLLERYENRLDIALSHYNGGSGVKNRQGELKVIPATRNYVNKVLNSQQAFLHHDNQLLSTSGGKPLYFTSMYNDTGIAQTDSTIIEPHSENPQIETLRALRLHNITRNYQSTSALADKNQTTHFAKPHIAETSLKTKMSKVRLWESIYTNPHKLVLLD
jgi:hypothetical protein